MQKLLEGIQDNYTLAQPGIQTKIIALKDLMKRLDSEGVVSEDSDASYIVILYLQLARS